MSKKLVLIWSTPNTDGLTAAAKDAFLAGVRETDATFEEIHLNRRTIHHCRACGNGWGNCAEEGKCVIDDDFADIYQKLAEADGFVLVTAVYWKDLTEQMKAFMDRLRRCERHSHLLEGRRCFLVACAGGSGLGTIECLHNMEEYLSQMRMRAYDRIPVNRFNREYILPALQPAGKTYAERLTTGFDMRF